MSSESDERTKPETGVDSPSADDSIDENVGGTVPLKKGPWTSAEDAILVEYVTKHGEGNWNAVQKHSGLARCGKSCRLRWANHLRPNLKKGAFTPEEENRIIELHAQIGNKWARMAAELPGRTDNEIKNYWNTRIKRRQRAGLPVYPPGVSLPSSDENLESDNLNSLAGNDGHPDLLPMDHLEIPAVEFKNLDLNNHFIKAPDLLSYPGLNFHDIHPSSLLGQGVKPTIPDKRLDPTVHPSKRLRGSELLFPDYSSPIYNAFPGGNQYQSESCMQIGQSSALSAYVHNPATDLASSSSLSNDHPSSEPPGAMKQELPSLQRQMGTWGSPSPSSPLPFSDSADVFIETPPNEQMQSCNLLSPDSRLLGAVFCEPETMITPNGNGVHHYPNIPSMAAANTMDCSAPVLHDSEWRPCEDQLSYSPSSVFSESTRVSGNSMDDPFACPLPVMEDTIHGGLVKYDDIIDPSNELIYSGQDFLLESSPFGSVYHPTEEHSLLYDPTGTLLVDDFSRDREKVDLGATSSAQAPHANGSGAWSATSSAQAPHANDSGAWNDKRITRQCKFTSA